MFNTIVAWLKFYVRSERGQDLIEYALLGGLVAGALLAAAVLTGMTTAVVRRD
jgi:Flp pilus assembly pilin Flp